MKGRNQTDWAISTDRCYGQGHTHRVSNRNTIHTMAHQTTTTTTTVPAVDCPSINRQFHTQQPTSHVSLKRNVILITSKSMPSPPEPKQYDTSKESKATKVRTRTSPTPLIKRAKLIVYSRFSQFPFSCSKEGFAERGDDNEGA